MAADASLSLQQSPGEGTAVAPPPGHEPLEETLSYVAADANGLLSTVLRPGHARLADEQFDSGERLNDRYELQQEIGRGGMGRVFLATDVRLGRKVAVKLIRADHWREFPEEMQAAFEEEARLGASLLHPAIATVFDFGIHGEVPFAVFEFVSGKSLREVLRERGTLPLEDVLDIVGRLATALDYAHQKGIVHRDLKPDNIRFDEHGHCKVLDLGLAKDFRRPGDSDWRFVGTPAYASPEQAAGHPADGRADQYALGLIAFEMLTGQRPFQAGSWKEMLESHRRQPAEFPPRAEPLPDAIRQAVLRALAKDPHERFDSCSEFASSLGGTFEALPETALEMLREAAVTEPVRFRDSGRLGNRRSVQLALQSEFLWTASEDRIRKWPLSGLSSVVHKGRTLTLAFRGQKPLSFRFSDRKEPAAWLEELERLKPPVPGDGQGPVEIPMPVLCPTRPNVRVQVLGNCEAFARTQADADSKLRLYAAMEDATAVVGVVTEKLVKWETTVRRSAGTVVRALESMGRLELISRWYLPQIRRPCRWLLVLIVIGLFARILSGVVITFSSSPTAGSALLRQQFGTLVAGAAALQAIPFAFTLALLLSHRPQLLRPTALVNAVLAVCPWVVAVSYFLTLGLVSQHVDRITLLVASGVLDPVSIALQVSGLLLSRRLWLVWRRYRTLSRAGAGEPVRRGALELTAGLAGLAYVLGLVGFSIYGGYVNALLARPGAQSLAAAQQFELFGDPDRARRELEFAARRNDASPLLHIELSRIQIQNGDFPSAIASATRAIEMAPDDSRGYINRSGAHTASGRADLGLQDAEKAIALDPRSSLAQINRSIALIHLRRLDEGVAAATRAAELDPGQALAYRNRAAALVDLGRYDEALRDTETALRLSPGTPQVLMLRGLSRLGKAEWTLAVPDLDQAAKLPALRPIIVGHLLKFADQSLKAGKPDEALSAIDKLDSLSPGSAWVHFARSSVRLNRSQFELAREDADKALALDPRSAPALANRGAARLGLEDARGCIDDCTAAILIDPRLASAYYYRSQAARVLGNLPEAEADERKALQLDPLLKSATVRFKTL